MKPISLYDHIPCGKNKRKLFRKKWIDEVIQKEMDRLEHLGIIHKGLTGYNSPVVLVKRKNQNPYRVVVISGY